MRPTAFSELALSLMTGACDEPLVPLSASHFMFADAQQGRGQDSSSQYRWVTVSDDGEGTPECVALALADAEGQVVLAVLGNKKAREEACVMAAVRGGGLRYFSGSGSETRQMALSQV